MHPTKQERPTFLTPGSEIDLSYLQFRNALAPTLLNRELGAHATLSIFRSLKEF
jgi:hypothetical protein